VKAVGGSGERTVALGLMAASGFAGLGYQIVWTQQVSTWLGHESAAVLAVVAAFFGGLALGGLLLGPAIERSAQPRRWYVMAELSIALWGTCLLGLQAPAGRLLLGAMGVVPSAFWHWSLAFGSTFCLLLPATAAMGATLPSMQRLLGERGIAGLYAANTAGAVVGVLGSAFWLIPSFGLKASASVCVTLNLACAAAARRIFPRCTEPVPAPPAAAAEVRAAVVRLAVAGLLGIGYEVVVVRVLSQVTEETVYTFALLLAVYLVFTALGAAAHRHYLEGHGPVGDLLAGTLALACLLGIGSLWFAESIRLGAQEALGAGLYAAIASEALLALLAFAPATLVMGAQLSELCRTANAAGVSYGRALGVNLLAGAAAPALFGVVLVPRLGPKLALLSIVFGYLTLISSERRFGTATLLPAGAALSLGLLAPPLRFVQLPEGGRLLSYREGVMAAVSVVEDAGGVRRLRIDNRQQEGDSVSLRFDAREAWLPLLLHPSPRRALFLGLGTGVTASSAAADPTLEVDAVELLPEVVEASTAFRDSGDRLRVVTADARRFVRASESPYDVIVSDNFHPARSGSGALYTVEHFRAVRERLSPHGVFCQWLPLHQLDVWTLRSIVATFLAASPHALAVIASSSLETPVLGLVARRDDGRFDAVALERRLAGASLARQLHTLGFEDELAVLGSIVAGPAALSRFGRGAPLNTDDRPIVAYRAPRLTYAPDSSPAERLLEVLAELSASPSEVLIAPSSSEQRIAAYWVARNRFIASGRHVVPQPRVQDMLSQVREPLLGVLRTSPDFRPAYDPLLSMAAALARSDSVAARALLAELAALQPARSEASELLARLGGRVSQTSSK
jgi:spermidine synthase